MPDHSYHTINAEQYEAALDVTVSDDEIRVDRQGFSPDVADEHGRAYFPDDTIYLFSYNQLDVRQEESQSYIGDVLTHLAEETDLRAHLAQYDSIAVGLEVGENTHSHMYETFTVTASMAPGDEDTQEQVTTIGSIEDLELDDLRDTDRLTDMLEHRPEGSSELIHDHDAFQDEFHVHIGDFSYSPRDMPGTTYHFGTDTPVYVHDGETRPDPALEPQKGPIGQDPIEIDTDDADVLSRLNELDVITIDEQQVIEDYQERGQVLLEDRGITHDPGTMEFYRALVDLDDVPAEIEALEGMYRDGDLSIETDADRIKLDYVKEEDIIEQLVSDAEFSG